MTERIFSISEALWTIFFSATLQTIFFFNSDSPLPQMINCRPLIWWNCATPLSEAVRQNPASITRIRYKSYSLYCMGQDFGTFIHPPPPSISFLSPPVRMHGGLLCIVLRMSVTWPKFSLEVKSIAKKQFREGIPVKLLEIFNDIGRWAHFNVKLHFFSECSYDIQW